METVKGVQVGKSYISWSRVAERMEGRTKQQCKSYYLVLVRKQIAHKQEEQKEDKKDADDSFLAQLEYATLTKQQKADLFNYPTYYKGDFKKLQ